MTTKQDDQSKVEEHVLRQYELHEFKGKGAYGIVWKATDKLTKQSVALKKVFDAFQNATDAQRTFREVVFLQQLTEHDNIVKLLKVLPSENQKDLYMVFEFMETDLHKVIRAGLLNPLHMQYIIYQLLKCLKYIHSGDLIHRDLKPSNLLIDSDCKVKVADFGLARTVAQSQNENELPIMTEYVATRWYRAPEILLGSHNYQKAVDMWSVGCILGEMLQGKAIFSGASTLNQIEKVIELIGRPKPEDLDLINAPMAQQILDSINMQKRKSFAGFFPNASTDAIDFIRQCFDWNPNKRMTVEQALKHPLMKEFASTEEEKTLKHIIKVPFNDNKKLTVKDYRDKIHNHSQSSLQSQQSQYQVPQSRQAQQQISQPSTIANYLKNYDTKPKVKEVSVEKKSIVASQPILESSPQPKKPMPSNSNNGNVLNVTANSTTYSQLLQQKYIQQNQQQKKPQSYLNRPPTHYESKSPEQKKIPQASLIPTNKSYSFHTHSEPIEKKPSQPVQQLKYQTSQNTAVNKYSSISFYQPKDKPVIPQQQANMRSKSFEKNPINIQPTSPFARQKTAADKPKFIAQSSTNVPSSISQVQKLLQKCSQLSSNFTHKKTASFIDTAHKPMQTVNYNYFDTCVFKGPR